VRPTADAEVVVVGAGVMGVATARALARSGRDVVLCEQFQIGHARGSSHGGSRIVRLSYPKEHWVRLAQQSYPLWRQLETECGRTLLEQPGTLDLGEWQANRDALAACSARFEVLGRAEIERRFPVRVEPGEQGLYQAEGGIVLADLAVEALLASAVASGAALREHVRVDSVVADADGVVAGGIRARAAVVTAGAWAPALAGVDAHVTSETTSYFAFDEQVPSLVDSAAGAILGYALAAPGIGLKAGLHQSGPVVDPNEPGGPDGRIAAETAAWVERRFRGVGAAAKIETCLYTTRQDDEFLLRREGRIVVGSACSGHGFKFAPLIGEQLAKLAEEAL
jgi:sarcosine oxidase